MNNTSVFPNTQFSSAQDHWCQLKNEFVGQQTSINGASISYYDYLTAQRIHYFDLSKEAKKYQNQSVSLNITATRDDKLATQLCDVVYLVEKQSVVEINMSTGSAVIVCGQSI